MIERGVVMTDLKMFSKPVVMTDLKMFSKPVVFTDFDGVLNAFPG